MSDSPEKKWLVRSSNVILGPYARSEIQDLLKQSVLSVHDEVTAPCTFWRPLRDHPEFKDIAASFQSKKNLSHIITSISGKITSSFTASEPTKPLPEEMTETLTEPGEQETQSFPQESQTQTIPPAPLKTAQQPTPPPRPKKTVPRPPEQKAKKASSLIFWLTAGVLLLGVAGYGIFQTNLRRTAEKTQSFSVNIREAALSAYKSGNYEKALRNFELGRRENLLGPEENLLMISLLLQQNKGPEAAALLESVPENERSDTRFLLVQGLLALHEKRLPAAEKFFTEAGAYHSQTALLSLGLVKFFEKEHRASLAYVEKLIQSGWNRGIAFYLKALNQTALYSRAAEGGPVPSDYLEKTPEYHQEINLLQAYLSLSGGDKKKTADFVGKVLNGDPYFYRDYHYNSFLPVNLPDWNILADYCDQVYRSSPNEPLFNTLKGFCLLKAGDKTKGGAFMERAKAQAPEDPVILSLYGFYLMQSGFFTEAEEILGPAAGRHNKRNFPLPHIMRGRLYESRGEWASAHQSWKKVLSLNSYHIPALAGIATAAFHLKKPKDAMYYTKKGLALYPHNKRLLILKDLPANGPPPADGASEQ